MRRLQIKHKQAFLSNLRSPYRRKYKGPANATELPLYAVPGLSVRLEELFASGDLKILNAMRAVARQNSISKLTSFASHAFVENAEPLHRPQSTQWHTTTEIGGPVTVY
jgi:hypothetical protein